MNWWEGLDYNLSEKDQQEVRELAEQVAIEIRRQRLKESNP